MASERVPVSEQEILRTTVDMLRKRLPPSWQLKTADRSCEPNFQGLDTVLTITSPERTEVTFAVEVKRLIERRSVGPILERLATAIGTAAPAGKPLVVARYLSPQVQEALTDRAVSFIDLTGNMSVTSDRPAFFVRDRGEAKDPWRERGRPRGTLKGEPAARIVRTLVGSSATWTARDLVQASGTSTGATYRVLQFLQEEDLVVKTDGGRYETTNWRKMLGLWSREYGFVTTNRTYRFLEPRGLPALLQKMPGTDRRYAVTGTVASAQWAAYAPARSMMVYVDDAESAADAWGLRATEAGANVILAEPKYEVVFERTSRTTGGYKIAAIAQVAVDLLTGPGRNPSEGEELIEWMAKNEQSWRD